VLLAAGKDRCRKTTPSGGDGIEQANLHAAGRGETEHHGEHSVLDLV
jgi:hypothetical protein